MSNVHTEHVEYLLPEYLNHGLEEPLHLGVEKHLEECASCRAELRELQEAFISLEVHTADQPPHGYFSSILPRVRERLEENTSRSFLAHPLVTRLAAPLAAGLVIFLVMIHVPFPIGEAEREHNPLQPVLSNVDSEELLDIVLDQVHRQALNTVGESEASSLLAVPILRSDHLLNDVQHLSMRDEPLLSTNLPEGLDQLSESDIDVLVQRLGERTIL
jgi:hypothetical protein